MHAVNMPKPAKMAGCGISHKHKNDTNTLNISYTVLQIIFKHKKKSVNTVEVVSI